MSLFFGSLSVGGIEEWRNVQWAFGELRHMDEHQFTWSHLYIKGMAIIWISSFCRIKMKSIRFCGMSFRMAIVFGVWPNAIFAAVPSSICVYQTKWSIWSRKMHKWKHAIARKWKVDAINRINGKADANKAATQIVAHFSNEIREIIAAIFNIKNHNRQNRDLKPYAHFWISEMMWLTYFIESLLKIKPKFHKNSLHFKPLVFFCYFISVSFLAAYQVYSATKIYMSHVKCNGIRLELHCADIT